MKLRSLSVILLSLALASSLWSARRNAFEVVLGDDAEDTDCSYTHATPTWTASPSFSPSPSPTATVTPVPDTAVDAIQALGFAAEWEGADTLKVTLSDVSARFDTGKAKLKPEAVVRLQKLAGLMSQFPGSTLQVDGHTDPDGKGWFNRMLSLKRAETVRDVMVQMGVPAGTFVAVSGWAATKPLVTSLIPEELAQNRRVEVRVHMAPGFDPKRIPTAPPTLPPTPVPTPAPAEPSAVSPNVDTAVPAKP
jgi:outer membrane protein OmpA-like peptidoglycan-associated protein